MKKAYEELTYLGRIRRMRQLALVALKAYGLEDARCKFLKQAGNTLFRVRDCQDTHEHKPGLFSPGEYMLRIHQPGYQTTEAIVLELMWLQSMRMEADLPVPEPVATLEGQLLAQVSAPGIDGVRNCSLLRWVKGRFITEGIGRQHYRAQGQLLGRMHNHSSTWKVPPGLTKRKFDWGGLFQDDLGEGMKAKEAWRLLPSEYIKPYEEIAKKVKLVMEQFGKGREVYGLIHGDLGMDANILFRKGEARAIDFDDSGFGYYLYDLSLALEHCQEDERLNQYREALLEGYTAVRALLEDQIKHLDVFLVAYYVYLSLWAVAAMDRYPKYKDELTKRIERAFRLVQRNMKIQVEG